MCAPGFQTTGFCARPAMRVVLAPAASVPFSYVSSGALSARDGPCGGARDMAPSELLDSEGGHVFGAPARSEEHKAIARTRSLGP